MWLADLLETIHDLGVPGKLVRLCGQPEVLQRVKKRLSNYRNPIASKPRVLMFNGCPGTGKTLMAEIIAQLLFKSKDPARYFFFNKGQMTTVDNFSTLVGAVRGSCCCKQARSSWDSCALG